jgi:hypothetical protein
VNAEEEEYYYKVIHLEKSINANSTASVIILLRWCRCSPAEVVQERLKQI